MGVVQKGEELLARRKLQQEIMEEELQHEKNVAIEAKFKEEASKHHCILSVTISHSFPFFCFYFFISFLFFLFLFFPYSQIFSFLLYK